MTKNEFITQINRLKSVFGDRSYPDERVKIIWDKFSCVNDAEFSDCVSKLISENRMPPMVPEFSVFLPDVIVSSKKKKIEKIKNS